MTGAPGEHSATRSGHIRYRREIDGLRAVAVVPVILFHAGFSLFGGGFVGVDVFFVISGYLITSIIISDLEGGKFSIVKFYERRARRILPALFFVILCCLPFVWMWMLPPQIDAFARSVMAVGLFVSNFLFWRESGYFTAAAEEKPLLHTWSLAVEEQYYVLFPLFMVLAWRFGRNPAFYAVMVFAALSLLLNELALRAQSVSQAAVFYLTPFRAWELLAGSICAFLCFGRPQKVSNLASAVGLAMILVAIFIFDKSTPFPSLYALLPVVGTALIILFAGPSTVVGRLLSLPAFVGIGLISYSAYLWHQPLFAFARIHVIGGPSPELMLLLALVTLPLAWASWRFIEQPFRSPGGFDRQAIFSMSGAGIALCLVFGSTAMMSRGFEDAWRAQRTEQIRAAYDLAIQIDPRSDYGADGQGRQDNGDCRFNLPRINADVADRLRDCHERYGPGVAILGDSHAIDLFGTVTAGNDAPFIAGFTQGGCRPHDPQPGCQYEGFATFVTDQPDVFAGIIFEMAGFYLLRTDWREGDRELFAGAPLNTPLEEVHVDQDRFSKVHAYLKELGETTPVLWFGPRLAPHYSQADLVRLGCDYSFSPRPGIRDAINLIDQHIEAAAGDDGDLKFLSQNDAFRIRFPDDIMTCDQIFWSDGDHLSAAGEQHLGARFDLLSYARSRFGAGDG